MLLGEDGYSWAFGEACGDTLGCFSSMHICMYPKCLNELPRVMTLQ